MPPIDDDKPRHVMSDDERATIGEIHRRKRESDPPRPPKPGSFAALFARIPTTWKALTLISAIFLAGVAGHAYLISYTAKYATRDDLSKHEAREIELREQVRVLREHDAALTVDISSIKTDTAAVREDIRTLLQHMLGNPPTRVLAPGRAKKP